MPADPRRILVLNQYVVPDTAVTGRVAFEIAAALAGAGHAVTFLAGQPSYHAGLPAAPRHELRDGVEVRRLRIVRRGGRDTRVARFLGYLSYLAAALVIGRRLCRSRRIDTIICFHNPPFVAVAGALLARGGRRLICVEQDLHPDVILATGWITLPRPAICAWRAVNRLVRGRAWRIVAITEDIRGTLIEQGAQREQVVTIPLWAQPELEPVPQDDEIRRELGIGEHELMVLFAGNMGLTQRLEPVFEAASLLAGASVRFVFAGGGIHGERWRTQSAGAPNVTFLGFQPEDRYRRLVAAADVGLVTLTPRLERLVVPSRAFPLISAGIPLLAVMSAESELGRLVAAYGCGACAEEPATIAAALRGWLADPAELARAAQAARAGYLATRSRATMLKRYIELV